jgi:hypothetical protein
MGGNLVIAHMSTGVRRADHRGAKSSKYHASVLSAKSKANLIPLNMNHVAGKLAAMALLRELCEQLGFEEHWLSNVIRKPRWREAGRSYKRHHLKFLHAFPAVSFPFDKITGHQYINACLLEIGVAQRLILSGDTAYFETASATSPPS